MRTVRQNAILKLVGEHEIQTQEELSELLRKNGFDVTQATVSRDVKELRLVKVKNNKGTVCYRVDKTLGTGDVKEKLHSILKHSMVSVACAGNDVVIKTLPGVAQAAAASIDAMHWDEILGTIAGDDTILIVASSPSYAKEVVLRLENI